MRIAYLSTDPGVPYGGGKGPAVLAEADVGLAPGAAAREAVGT